MMDIMRDWKIWKNRERFRDRSFRKGCVHNAHMYYIKVKDIAVRTRLIAYLRENGIAPAFHYVPLHSSPAGEKFGRFHGKDVYTTKEKRTPFEASDVL